MASNTECCEDFTCLITKITVYGTKETLYIVGSDENEKIFRTLEISRNERQSLVIYDEKKTLTIDDVKKYVNKQSGKSKLKGYNSPMVRIAVGCCIAGFVRFTEGYYMILVTARQKVAKIGVHVIYKVEGTHMIYIPNDKVLKSQNPSEQRYVKLFENVDLSNHFYFSYTYDLTHTLQYNQLKMGVDNYLSPKSPFVQARQFPAERFVWNQYLLEPCMEQVHDDWVVHLIHGYLSQLNMTVFGRHVYLTLIARRSNKYAGPRFLKRGCNTQGDVANEVETEQIVLDTSQTSLDTCSYASYVQLRGSIPLYWSQDLNTIAMSRPPINLYFSDPYGSVVSSHLRDVLRRYGAPIIVFSLLKRREKRKRESILWDEFNKSIDYLNQFLPDEHKIKYVTFDMARSNRKKGSNVMAYLDEISEKCIERTGMYVRNSSCHPDSLQHGVIRTNCIDCLDRTNTAQFAVGKHALGHQLKALGITAMADLEYDNDCMRMLESLYEDQGDNIALQYGGSNLVHRIQSYRKTNMLATHSNDILQTLSRYYSNSFSDSEKQQAFNVFLGVYRPYEESVNLWELSTDHYLHNRKSDPKQHYCNWIPSCVAESLPLPHYYSRKTCRIVERDQAIMDMSSFKSVYRLHELTTFDSLFSFTIANSIRTFMPKTVNIECNPYLTSPFQVRKTIRWRQLVNNQPRNTLKSIGVDCKNDAIQASFSSLHSSSDLVVSSDPRQIGNSVFHAGSTTEDTDSSSSDESDIEYQLDSSDDDKSEPESSRQDTRVTFHDMFESPFHAYGIDMQYNNRMSQRLYKNIEKFYDQVSHSNPGSKVSQDIPINISCKSILRQESIIAIEPPTVNKKDKKFYTSSVMIGQYGASGVPKVNEMAYLAYLTEVRF